MTETVTEAVVTPIAFPDPPLLNASGVHQPWALRTIVELRIGTELVGLGETYGDAPHLELVRRAAEAVVGVDPFDLADLHRRIAAVGGGSNVPDLHRLTGGATPGKSLLLVDCPVRVAVLHLPGLLI